MASSIVYGPVPSRRLGRSLGINNIIPKTCSYACIYCQVGRTTSMTAERKAIYKPSDMTTQVKNRLKQLEKQGEQVDFLTFVPNGEPTLDAALGRSIELLRDLNKRIAVITNASLLWQEDTRHDLLKADLVSLKVDAVNKETWLKVNRPQKSLNLESILRGMLSFRKTFTGELITETMLIRGVNDDLKEIEEIADFLAMLKPDTAYLAIPTRPPAEGFVIPAREQTINMAYQIFAKRLSKVEYLIGYEGNAFVAAGDIQNEILNITSVHPMREDAVIELLKRKGASWPAVQQLIDSGSLAQLEYQGHRFYIRKLPVYNSQM